jgi:hypothetical protein
MTAAAEAVAAQKADGAIVAAIPAEGIVAGETAAAAAIKRKRHKLKLAPVILAAYSYKAV